MGNCLPSFIMNYIVVIYESGKHFYVILYRVTNNSAPAFKDGNDIYNKLDMMYKSAINITRKIVFDYFDGFKKKYHLVNENQLSPYIFNDTVGIKGYESKSPIRYVTLCSHNKADMRKKMKKALIADSVRRLPIGSYSFIYYNDGIGLVEEKLVMTYMAEENGSFRYEIS